MNQNLMCKQAERDRLACHPQPSMSTSSCHCPFNRNCGCRCSKVPQLTHLRYAGWPSSSQWHSPCWPASSAHDCCPAVVPSPVTQTQQATANMVQTINTLQHLKHVLIAPKDLACITGLQSLQHLKHVGIAPELSLHCWVANTL